MNADINISPQWPVGPWREIAIGRDGAHLAMLPFASIAQPFGIEFPISDDERHRRVIRLVRLLALVCRVTGQAKASGIVYIVNGLRLAFMEWSAISGFAV